MKKQKTKALSLKWRMMIILVLPALIGVIRKLVPGQPNWLEGLPLALFVGLIIIGRILVKKNQPSIAYDFILIWVIFVSAYSIPAFFVNPLFGLQALVLGAGAPLIGLAFLRMPNACDSIQFNSVAKLFVGLIAFQSLFGLVLLSLGPDALPYFLRANEMEISIGKEYRIGQAMLAGYFTTSSVNSIATLCAFGFACTLLLQQHETRKMALYGALTLIVLMVVWMTARRGALFAAFFIGFITLLFARKWHYKKFLKLGLIAGLVVAPLFLVLGTSVIEEILFGERLVLLKEGSLDLASRFNDVFLQFLLFWLNEAPFGNYTGYASGVGKAYNVRDLGLAAEVGGAMIVAEFGIVGVVLFILVFVALQFEMITLVRRLRTFWCVPLIALHSALFTIFFFKENSAMFPGFIGSLCFWALPGLVILMSTSSVKSRINPSQSLPMHGSLQPYKV